MFVWSRIVDVETGDDAVEHDLVEPLGLDIGHGRRDAAAALHRARGKRPPVVGVVPLRHRQAADHMIAIAEGYGLAVGLERELGIELGEAAHAGLGEIRHRDLFDVDLGDVLVTVGEQAACACPIVALGVLDLLRGTGRQEQSQTHAC